MLVHSSYSHSLLEIKGCWILQGPQETDGEHGAPKYLEDIFKNNPKIQSIVIQYEDSGVVYQRMENL